MGSASYVCTLAFRDRISFEYFGEAASIGKFPVVCIESVAFLVLANVIENQVGRMTPFVAIRSGVSTITLFYSLWRIFDVCRTRYRYQELVKLHAESELWEKRSVGKSAE